MLTILKRTTAVAALAALPFAPAALAQSQQEGQQAQNAEQQGQNTQPQAQKEQQKQKTQQQAQGTQGSSQAQAEGGAGQQADATVATVNEQPIRRSDVMTVIGELPPQMQQQPAEMLVPMAIDQLVLRELILQEARDADLANDPEVRELAEGASERARDDAMVQVWLDRELQGAVSDSAVQDTYESVRTQFGDQAPPLDAIRPQIEQELRRQAFVELSEELQADAEVVLFGPGGEQIPVE